jgi:hypothetical protein
MEQLDAWSEFNVAMVGTTAALAGLVIVAASVNIGDIIKAGSLTARLAAGIAGLVLALAGSAIGLFPGIGRIPYGLAVIVLAAGAAVFQLQAARRIMADPGSQNHLRWPKSVVGFLAPLAYIAGGALVALGDPHGLAWMAIGSIVAVMAALLISWIVLVEVLR